METTTLIRGFQEFLEKNYYAELLEKLRRGEKFLVVNFGELSKFDPELADLLLDNPDEILKVAQLAVEQFDIKEDISNFSIRIRNLSESAKLKIRDIRSINLNKFYFVEGVIKQKSDVRPQVTSARFECPACGNIISILQFDRIFKEPTKCSCGRKGKFKLLSKELVDAQGLVLEESAENLEGGEQPKKINVFLKNDLVSPLSERKTNPGTKVRIVGIVKEVPRILRTGGLSTTFDLMFEANFVEALQEDFGELIVDEEEFKKIIELSKDKELIKKVVEAIAPSIYGHEKIKEALALQLLGGVRKLRDDGVFTRGDIHMLLVGDPGAAKSQILKRINIVAPKGKYITGKGASGAGLSATVVKDEFLQGWSLEAGALVLANKGIAMIDELDKMSKEDGWAMHEALEQQTITISKANIQATLRCETAVLAAANPKFGRFDPYDTVASQIDLEPTLINRFDLIFPIKDLPEPVKDEKMAKFILGLHQNIVKAPEIPTALLRKYIAYAKQNFAPKLTDSAVEELRDYFLKMRSSVSAETAKSVPISARQLEGLIRLSEAYAKLRLSDKVITEDARRAIELLDYCLRQVAFDEETGTFDVDRIATSVPASQRNKIMIVKEIIAEIENRIGKVIPLEDVMREAEIKNIEKSETEEIIQRLKRSGDLFEPKHGFIGRI